YASNALSMTVPFAGAQLAVVFSYRQFRRRGLGQAITGWALAVSAILSMSALAVVIIAGSIASGASVATAVGFAGAALLILPAVAMERAAARLCGWRRGRQHGAHPRRLRAGRGDPDRGACGRGDEHVRGADLGARLPADQLLDDPDRRVDGDDRADPDQEPYR